MTNPVTGEIKVDVHECEITAEVEFEHSNTHFTGAGKVHEKSKKALGHQVGYTMMFYSKIFLSLVDECLLDSEKKGFPKPTTESRWMMGIKWPHFYSAIDLLVRDSRLAVIHRLRFPLQNFYRLME